MIRKLPSRFLIVALMAGGYCTSVVAQDPAEAPGSPDRNAQPAEVKPSPRAPRIRKSITMKLPDQYRSRDTDKDGQIGLYEWPRSDYATFRKLDLNGDGFLTPQELTRGARPKSNTGAFGTKRTPSADSASATTSRG